MLIYYSYSNNSININKFYDNINSNNLEILKSCDLFICDITPDIIIDNKLLYENNTIFELFYYIKLNGKNNLILICNKNIINNINLLPKLINNYDIFFYNNYIDIINNININNEYNIINYTLSNDFINSIYNFPIYIYDIIFNKTNLIIKINNNKFIDLNNYDDNNEIKHLKKIIKFNYK